MPKKVCILNHGLASGGTDTFVITLAKGLAKDGYNVTIALAVDPDSEKQFREEEVKSLGNITIYKTSDLNNVKKMLLHSVRLYHLLKDGHYEIFHANMDMFNGINMLVAWLAGVPVRVCHSHNTESQYEAKNGKHIVIRCYRFVMRCLLLTFSNRLCGCSEEAMNYLFGNRWKKNQHSLVVYNGIDFSKFQMDGFEKELMRQKLELPSGPLLICVGRLEEQKNPFFAADVMVKLHDRRPDAHLIWIGGGLLEDRLKRYIKENNALDYIHLLGVKKNVNDYLRCASLYLMPSVFEGLGIAALEAQAAGLPVIISSTCPRLVDIGACSFLPLDGSVWVNKICDLLDSKEPVSLIEDKRKKFDQSYMVKQLETVYQRV